MLKTNNAEVTNQTGVPIKKVKPIKFGFTRLYHNTKKDGDGEPLFRDFHDIDSLEILAMPVSCWSKFPQKKHATIVAEDAEVVVEEKLKPADKKKQTK